jgi:hypothetical protein
MKRETPHSGTGADLNFIDMASFRKLIQSGGEKGSDLSKDVLSLINVLGFDSKVKSNRHRPKISYKPYQSNISKNFLIILTGHY